MKSIRFKRITEKRKPKNINMTFLILHLSSPPTDLTSVSFISFPTNNYSSRQIVSGKLGLGVINDVHYLQQLQFILFSLSIAKYVYDCTPFMGKRLSDRIPFKMHKQGIFSANRFPELKSQQIFILYRSAEESQLLQIMHKVDFFQL